MINYFAFGSNMSAQRMNDRLGWSPSPSGAILHDYVMVFNKHSNDGGKANIMYSPSNQVEGILYSVNEEDLLILDKFEGVATEQYKRYDIKVLDNKKKSIAAVAYKALNTGKLFAPTKEYLNYILEGKEFLSPGYYSKLESTETL
ncbi:gamma-glutamylcyclotransferase [bacterium]|nr:gamma-glutamylcyclotransferase [bacterium]